MDTPEWLGPRQDRAWRGYRRLRLLLDAQIARDLNTRAGLSEADYTVLAALSEAPGRRMRLRELTERTLWSKSRLSHQLSRMQQRGHLRREDSTEPGGTRGTDAVLTDEGLRVIEAAAPIHLESVRRHFLDRLTDEQVEVLGDLAEAVIEHLPSRPEGSG